MTAIRLTIHCPQDLSGQIRRVMPLPIVGLLLLMLCPAAVSAQTKGAAETPAKNGQNKPTSSPDRTFYSRLGQHQSRPADVSVQLDNMAYFGPNKITEPEIVLTRSMTDKELKELKQDIQIMDRLIQRAIGSPTAAQRKALGVNVPNNENSIRYVQGAGLVMTYPLGLMLWKPESEAVSKPSPPEKQADEWDVAQEQLFGEPRISIGYQDTGSMFALLANVSQPFSEALVKQTEEHVTKALKHVSRIRHFKANGRSETLVIVLEGMGGTRMTLTTDVERWKKDDVKAVSVHRYGTGAAMDTWNYIQGYQSYKGALRHLAIRPDASRKYFIEALKATVGAEGKKAAKAPKGSTPPQRSREK